MEFVSNLQVLGPEDATEIYAMLSDGWLTKTTPGSNEPSYICKTICDGGSRFAVSPLRTFACGSHKKSKLTLYSPNGAELGEASMVKPQAMAAASDHFVVVNERFEAFTLELSGKCTRYGRDAYNAFQLTVVRFYG